MKKLLMALVLLPLMAAADVETVDGIEWTYDVGDGKATVLRIPSGTTGAITIPSTFGGCPVVSIGDHAFEGCSGLTSVTIPSSVTSIGSYAFARCSHLSQVTVGENVQQMGRDAFSGAALMQVDGDKREIAYIGDWALGFKTCLVPEASQISSEDFYVDYSNVRKIDIVLKGETKHIADEAFVSIRFKTKGSETDGWDNEYTIPYGQIVLPDGLQTIGAGAFSTTFYSGRHRDRDLVIPSSVVWIGDGSLSGIADRRICFEGPRPQAGTPFSQDQPYGGEDISAVYYVSGTEGWNFGGEWCGVRTYPSAWLEKRVSRIKLGLVYEFDRDPGEHWLVHKEEVEDDEYFAIPVTGAANASEINPVVLHHNSSASDIASIEIWTDAQMFNAVLSPLLPLKSKWRSESRYDGSYFECPTSGEEAVWPADMWPADKAVPGRFWIVAKPNPGTWHGMRDFRVGLFGTDEVTERIYLAIDATFPPAVTDKACLETKRVAYAGRSAPHMSYGKTFCPGGVGSWGDCLGGTMFKTEGVRPASFTATVLEPGLFVLSVADSDYIWDEGTQTGHYIGENFKSQMTVSGGKIVADTEESLEERLDLAYTNLYWRYGGGGCIRRITVGEAGTYTFASKSQGDICANRFHFFPRNRDSVAIDAIFMEAQKCNSCSHDIANGYVLGSGVYVAGETAIFTAVPAPGERFDHWEVAFGELPMGLDLESPTLAFVVASDMCGAMAEERQIVIRAVWKKKYLPEIVASPVGAATVSGNVSVFSGEEVQVTLTPSAGCSFTRWIDGSEAGLSRKFSFAEVECAEPYRAIFTGVPDNPEPHFVVESIGGSYAVGTEIVPISVGVSDIGYVVTVGGLPPGLSFVNGRISGKPTKTGSFAVTATATKSGAQKLVRTFNIDVVFEFLYEETDGGIILTGTSTVPLTGELVIPSTYEGKQVKQVGTEEGSGLGQGAFANCEITSLVVSEGVEVLCCDAFRECAKLTSVTLPSTLKVIRDNCFEDCTALKSIVLPEGLERVEHDFLNRTAVSTLNIPTTLVDIEEGALAIPSGRKFTVAEGNPRYRVENGYVYDYVDKVVFMRADYSKKTFLIPDGAVRIAECCFGDCDGGSITIPASVMEIGESAFCECQGLTVTFLGGMPRADEEDGGIFNGSTNVKVYVQPGQGWDDVVARGTWQGRPVRFVGESPLEAQYRFVPGEEVDIDSTLIGYTAKGLPSGLKYDKSTGRITGTLTKPTATGGVAVTFTKSGEADVATVIIFGSLPTVSVKMSGVNSEGDSDGCKVTGAGAYLVGKTVTLKVTTKKGTAFAGFYKDGEPWPNEADCKKTSLVYAMGKEDVSLVAKFEKEKMSVGCTGLSDGFFTAGVAGSPEGIPLEIETQSGVKSVKVEKLPAGMKYDAKTQLVTGAPTKAGDNKVVITVTAVSGAVEKKEIDVPVAAMPETAVGTFNGFVANGEQRIGTFSLTTTDAGKLTAKVITAGGAVSFLGTCWDSVEGGVYRATLTTKKGEILSLTLDSNTVWDANQLSGAFTTALIPAKGKSAEIPSRTYSVSAQRNAFGKTWYFTAVGNEQAGWTFAYTKDVKAAALMVTLKADGSTAIAGKLPNGVDAKGKAVALKVSASGYANVGWMREGAIIADFAPIVTVNKAKRVLSIRANLWFDRSNSHEDGAGSAVLAE